MCTHTAIYDTVEVGIDASYVIKGMVDLDRHAKITKPHGDLWKMLKDARTEADMGYRTC